MNQERQLRKAGDWIVLGGTGYRLERVEGFGGSAVVYRAVYEDRLNQGCYHQVLIKELFPWHPKGWIYREDGMVKCALEGREFMERCRQSFYQGNQANLELLEQLPEQISGNLNSYEAYGTYYSVLAVHGGASLESILEEKGPLSLREAAVMVMSILDAVECFHRSGLLHLDISPDNLLMLRDRALLIDFNSVWQMRSEDRQAYVFSIKEGYSAPEVRLLQTGDIGPATDLYSVSAILFRMLTGNILSREDVMEKDIRRHLPRDLEIFRDQPPSAVWKAMQIVIMGLHVLARKRYRSAACMREELKELIRRIDGKGISAGAVWEASRRSRILKNRQKQKLEQSQGQEQNLFRREPIWLEQTVELDCGEEVSVDGFFSVLATGGRILLKGPGGMGKTLYLKHMWELGTADYSPRRPVVFYIPLSDYQEADHRTSYIRGYLLRRLDFTGQDIEGAAYELDRLLENDKRQPFILLLDGLNEAGRDRHGLLQEIEDLGRMPGMGIVVTDRGSLGTDRGKAAAQSGLEGFRPAELMPLPPREVERELERKGMSCPAESGITGLLGNPMLLALYERIMEMGENGNFDSRAPETGERLVSLYMDSLYASQMRCYAGNPKEQLGIGFILRHLLPDIAWKLKRDGNTLLTFESLLGLVKKNYGKLNDKNFALAFPEYMGKSRLMLKDISNEREWFDYGIREQLTERLELLEQTEEGNYRLIHENFLAPLAERGNENRQRTARYRRREWARRGLAAVLAAVFLSAGAIALQKNMPFSENEGNQLSDEEKQVVTNAVKRLLMNMQVVDIGAAGQRQILETALKDSVLEGDAKAGEELKRLIEKKEQDMERYISMADGGNGWLTELEGLNTDISLSTLQNLYGKPWELKETAAGAMNHLKDSLCREDSPYFGRSRREPLVRAYEEYLDRWSRVCYMELREVIWALDKENEDMLLDALGQMDTFRGFLLEYPLSGQSREDMERQTEAANRQLAQAEADMKMQKFQFGVPVSADVSEAGRENEEGTDGKGPDGNGTSEAETPTNISGDYRDIVHDFAAVILRQDQDSAAYDAALSAVGSYLADSSEENLKRAQDMVWDTLTQMTMESSAQKPYVMDREFARLLVGYGMEPEEYKMNADMRSGYLIGYTDSLGYLDFYLLSEELGDTTREALEFLYQYVSEYQKNQRAYCWCSINYWFAQWNEEETSYVKEQVLDKLESFGMESPIWETSRDAVERRLTAYLDTMEKSQEQWHEFIGTHQEMLYEMEKKAGSGEPESAVRKQ